MASDKVKEKATCRDAVARLKAALWHETKSRKRQRARMHLIAHLKAALWNDKRKGNPRKAR